MGIRRHMKKEENAAKKKRGLEKKMRLRKSGTGCGRVTRAWMQYVRRARSASEKEFPKLTYLASPNAHKARHHSLRHPLALAARCNNSIPRSEPRDSPLFFRCFAAVLFTHEAKPTSQAARLCFFFFFFVVSTIAGSERAESVYLSRLFPTFLAEPFLSLFSCSTSPPPFIFFLALSVALQACYTHPSPFLPAFFFTSISLFTVFAPRIMHCPFSCFRPGSVILVREILFFACFVSF